MSSRFLKTKCFTPSWRTGAVSRPRLIEHLHVGLYESRNLVGLLSLAAFVANGIFEERYVMLRFFGDAYRDHMQRVTARYFTPGQALVMALTLVMYIAGLFRQ